MMKTVVRKPVVPEKESKALGFLYNTVVGRCFLRILRAKWLSVLVGSFLNTRISKILIPAFIKSGNIDLDDYERQDYTCFNDCFCRKIKAERRPVDFDEDALVSPCDAFLSVYKIKEDSLYPVKQSVYTVESLLKNSDLAREFHNGYAFVFRLCVNHYHRYCYAASGEKSENIKISGTLHTVRPVALYKTKVFCENSREYTVINSDNFGKLIQMEVGAMLVGKINNFHREKAVKKGEEKGTFLYGGSTIILLAKEGKITPVSELLSATEKGLETPVLQGERINE